MTEKEIRANELATFYIEKTNHQNVPIKIHFVDNIDKEWINFTSDENVIRQYRNQDFSRLNGLKMPYDGQTYHLLINKNYKDYESTVIHECTHAFDYDRFRVEFNNGDINIEYHNDYNAMALYSEFHARAMAHNYYLNHNIIDNQVQFVKNEILATNNKIFELKNTFFNGNISDQEFSYELMQLVGRLRSHNVDYSSIDGFQKELLTLYNVLCSLDFEWTSEKFELLLKKLNDFIFSN